MSISAEYKPGYRLYLSLNQIKFFASLWPNYPQPTSFLGAGQRGSVYNTTDPNIVIKSTCSRLEVQVFQDSKTDKLLQKYLTKVFYIEEIREGWFLLWKEKVSTADKEFSDYLDLSNSVLENGLDFADIHEANWGYRSDGSPVFFDI